MDKWGSIVLISLETASYGLATASSSSSGTRGALGEGDSASTGGSVTTSSSGAEAGTSAT
jgi:hypothetical protein